MVQSVQSFDALDDVVVHLEFRQMTQEPEILHAKNV